MNEGEVWAVDFPFEDDPLQSKIRPCIILDVDTLVVLSIKVTSHVARDEFDVPIFKWAFANLVEPSFARVSKVLALPKSSFIKKYGELDEQDFKNITHKFMEYSKKNYT